MKEDMLEEIRANINKTLKETNLNIGKLFRGKVRDNYILADRQERIIITTDRISAFDRILGTLPFKGQVLNQLAAFWFEKTRGIFPNHLKSSPDPAVMITRECKPLPVEVVVRGYITGSLWRSYAEGKRDMYGIKWPEGLKKDQKLEAPVITPTTKEELGAHDKPVSAEEIMSKGIVDEETWSAIEEASLDLFNYGTEHLAKQGLILVDTKYEFGIAGEELVLIDEMHTPDSSRFWYADEYEKRFTEGKQQKMIDKEYVRQWLISKGFMGEGAVPEIPPEIIVEASRRYIEAYEKITGEEFLPVSGEPIERIKGVLRGKGYKV